MTILNKWCACADHLFDIFARFLFRIYKLKIREIIASMNGTIYFIYCKPSPETSQNLFPLFFGNVTARQTGGSERLQSEMMSAVYPIS
jgi:hypothetical protein